MSVCGHVTTGTNAPSLAADVRLRAIFPNRFSDVQESVAPAAPFSTGVL